MFGEKSGKMKNVKKCQGQVRGNWRKI